MGGFPRGASTGTGQSLWRVTNDTFLPYQGHVTTTSGDEDLQFITDIQPGEASSSIELPEVFELVGSFLDSTSLRNAAVVLSALVDPSRNVPLGVAALLGAYAGAPSLRQHHYVAKRPEDVVMAGDSGISRSFNIAPFVKDTGYNGNMSSPGDFVAYASGVIGDAEVVSLYLAARTMGLPPETFTGYFLEALSELVSEVEIYRPIGNNELLLERFALAHARAWGHLSHGNNMSFRFWNLLVNGDLDSNFDYGNADIETLARGTGFTGTDLNGLIDHAKELVGAEKVNALLALAEELGLSMEKDSRRMAVAISHLIKDGSEPFVSMRRPRGFFPLMAMLIDREDVRRALEERLASRYLPLPVKDDPTAESVNAMLAQDASLLRSGDKGYLKSDQLHIVDAIGKLSDSGQKAVISHMLWEIGGYISRRSSPDHVVKIIERYIRLLGEYLAIDGSLNGRRSIDSIVYEAKRRFEGARQHNHIVVAMTSLEEAYDRVGRFAPR